MDPMGIPIAPIDPIYGPGCARWLEDEDTPKYIYVYFWEIIACPDEVNVPPNFHTFKLTQVDGSPCAWQYRGDDYPWDIDLSYAIDGKAWLDLWDKDAHTFFEDYPFWPLHEHHVFTNQIAVCPDGHGAAGGNALIFWKEAAVKLLADMSLPTDSQILMEFFVTADHKPVYKFCLPEYSMNVKFLISP